MERNRTANLIAMIVAAILMVVLIVGHVRANQSQIFRMPEDGQLLTASVQGRNGPVEVEVAAGPTAFYRVKILSHEETEGIGTLAVDAIPNTIMETQRLDFDAVSGATITSEAIRSAVASALESGGIDPAAFGYVAPTPAPEKEEAPKPAPAPAAAAGGNYVPGTYTAEATGMGTVKVSVTVDENAITEVVLDTAGETPEIGGAATEELTSQVMAAQGPAIDGVSGATLTSNAVSTAVADALAQAAAAPAAAAGGAYVPGTYTAEATGMGTVKVSVTVDENAITEVVLDTAGETPEIGGAATEELTSQVMAAQGPAIDGVSGATLTSNAVSTAVADALAQAAAAPAENETAGTEPASEPEAAAKPEETAEPEAAEPETAAPAAAADVPDGAQTLKGSGLGKVGDVDVEVVADENTIYSITVVEYEETPGIGTLAVDQIPAAIVEAQSLQVDAVAGATITTDAIKKAVAAALVSGGIDASKFEKAVEAAAPEAADVPDGARTLKGSGLGKVGDVDVEVVADENTIYSITVVKHDETPGIGTVAVDQIPAAIVEAQSLQVDAIAGATMTTDAIKEAVAAALVSGGIDASKFEKAVEAAAAPEAAAGGAYVPGTYTAEATGMGTVKVSLTVDENAITEVVLDTAGETPAIGGAAAEELTSQVMAAQGAGIDGVSGATITSDAVRKAVADALAQAAAPAAAETEGTESAAETEDSSELKESADQEETASAAKTQTLIGKADGRNGPIEVEVVMNGDEIVSVEVISQSETEGIGSVAIAEIPAAIVDEQSILLDAVSGATVTSEAILNAVAAALEVGGLDPADFELAAEAADEAEEDLLYDVDVVVVGAGGAGMTAAITAADAGRTVLLLESQGIVGGNSARSTGGMNAAPTEWQQANEFGESAGVESTLKKVENFPDNKRIQELGEIVAKQWEEYQANPEGYFDSSELFQLDTLLGGGGLNDPSLVNRLVENSPDAIAWLGELDPQIVLHNVAAFGGASVKRIHRPVDENGKTLSVGAYVVPLLKENLDKRGNIELLTNTTATRILMDNGAAVGVVAETAKGATVTVNAKAVVITTGGFGANNDMIASLRPELDGFITTNSPGIQGQGIVMAQAVGADTVDMEQIQLHPTVHVQGSDAVLITEGLRGDGAILVNQEGERFFDEVSTRDKVSNAEFAQTGGYAWLIVDSRMSEASNVIQGYINKGYAETGETYEELAKAIGAPADAFAATMEKWNACVEAKEDADFGRVSFANPLDQAPYYAIKVQPGIHHTMGGIKINEDAQVIDTEGNVIAGLFAAGEVTGGVHGNNRLGGNAVADFTIFGRIAGTSAAAYAGGEPEAAEPDAETAKPADAAQTLTGSAMGKVGPVEVEVVTDGDRILSVTVLSHEETPAIGTLAVEQIPDAIVAHQGLDIDAVAGATVTSEAILAAVAAALESGGIDLAA